MPIPSQDETCDPEPSRPQGIPGRNFNPDKEALIWEFPKRDPLKVPKGTDKGSIKGLGFRVSEKFGVPYFGGPYSKDPTI